jgi:1-acyl-sn-glycerol-3-phosphate acyltransferase
MPDWLESPWYELAARVCQAGLFLGYRLRVEGQRYVPPTGPLLVIANHESFIDPVAIGCAVLPRHISYLARKTLFKDPRFARLLTSVRSVPIDQEGVGKEGIKSILGQLQAGRAVLVFPEGERTWDGRMQPFKPGVSLLVKRVQAPILPVGIAGAYWAWPRTRKLPYLAPWPLMNLPGIAVAIGRPLDPAPYAAMDRDAMLAALFEKVKAQHDRAERLRAAGTWRRLSRVR